MSEFPKQYASLRYVGKALAGELSDFLSRVPANATIEIGVRNEVIVGVSRGSDVTTVSATWSATGGTR